MGRCYVLFRLTVITLLCSVSSSVLAEDLAEDLAVEVTAALERAGDNREQIQQALEQTPAEQRAGMRFLVAWMPDRDLTSLAAETLLENVRLAYKVWNEARWKDEVPERIFLNNVLPYASINERRDDWREDFQERFLPLVRDAGSPAEAAALLNQNIYKLLNVRYSTKRNRADQAPLESIRTGLASCTGLSVLLIDACRAVGVPARFAGTPLWTNKSGNHSWVEIWDDGWHFTGAAEPMGDKLDKAWFVGRAATAKRDDPQHAIYAVSYKRTPLTFPLVWDSTIDYVFAVNVTDRYTARAKKIPAGHVEVQFLAIDGPNGDRCAAPITLSDAAGNRVFEGVTKDERFDANDHLSVLLRVGQNYDVEVRHKDRVLTRTVKGERRDTPVTLPLTAIRDSTTEVNAVPSNAAVAELKTFLDIDAGGRPAIDEQTFTEVPLTREDAARAGELLWQDHVTTIRTTRAAEMQARELVSGDLRMPFFYRTFGDRPPAGRSLYISMHGGGGAPKQVNDRQWENQKRLYTLEEGVYVAPRAPTNTWNLWHQGHIDGLFDRLIENMVVFEDVNPDRVYVMGYSAGGDGVYQLAPRMADRWAAAAMMAGHPNETSPLGLRNLPFTLHVGGRDGSYNRNKTAAEWQQKLAALRKADPGGYVHMAKIYPDKGHWLDREDAAAISWMAEHRRNTRVSRIVWKQDDVVHQRFYWLAVQPEHARARAKIRADLEDQNISITAADLPGISVRLDDQMLNLDRPLKVTLNGQVVFEGVAPRTIAAVNKTLSERGDLRGIFTAELEVAAANVR
ncbi:MAG: polyhydroxyalkanoate depolymerase [Fuerstiella sp.]|nr:polyhydroxyalkanoate depolymerase [Fuerstiella sp.]MCP4856739.1 polyhydroxyalkanoate depolymerase [Fuerstiella sp.]